MNFSTFQKYFTISNIKKYKWEIFIIISILCLIIAYFYRDNNYKFEPTKEVILKKKKKIIKKKHEKECKRILEKIFNCEFNSIRPDFLKNPETGKNLELDLWNKDLNLALEYQGIQHRQFSPYFHKKHEDFLSQIKRDTYKKMRCKELKIDFIEVPDTVKFDDLEKYIRNELTKLGRSFNSAIRVD
jgi:hypothetical protein